MNLIFSRSQTRESFTNSSTAQFDDKNEHALLRELIQNSLDAARPDTPAAIDIFHLNVNRDEVPCLKDLEDTLKLAEYFNENYSATKRIVPAIESALKSDKIDLLVFKDNGCGLNIDRMNDILHDGASRKDPGSAGSYGNGHFTTFKFSELLYVLYLGVSEDSGVLITGHTILASHKSESEHIGFVGTVSALIKTDLKLNEQQFRSPTAYEEGLLARVNIECTPTQATSPDYWGSITLALIENNIIKSRYLAAKPNHNKAKKQTGGYQIDHAKKPGRSMNSQDLYLEVSLDTRN